MTTLEKAARALHEQDRDAFGALSWEALEEQERGWYFDCARAAIEALRPDAAMLEKPGLEAAMLSSMVDAILEEKV